MKTPSIDWRPNAAGKAILIITAASAVNEHLVLLGDRIQNEYSNIERAQKKLAEANNYVAQFGTPNIDMVARAESELLHYKTRLNALIERREETSTKNASLLKLASAVKDLCRKFGIEVA